MTRDRRNCVLAVAMLIAVTGLALAFWASRADRELKGGAGRPLSPGPRLDDSTAALRVDGAEGRTDVSLAALEHTATRRSVSRVAGRVVHAGGVPFPGAEIRVDGVVEALADDSGAFAVELHGRGEVWMAASAPGFVAVPAPPLHLQLTDLATLELVLESGLDLTGSVRARGGDSVAGARVAGRAVRADGLGALTNESGLPSRSWLESTTASDGTFRLGPLPEGRVELVVTHPEFVGFGRAYPTDSGSIEIDLDPLPVIVGRVVEAGTKEPRDFDRVRVLIRTGGDDEWRPIDDPSGVARDLDGSGRFRLTPRVYRPVRLVVTSPHFATAVSPEIAIGRRSPGPIELSVEPGLPLGGVVVDDVGTAVAGAQVTIRAVDGDGRSFDVTTEVTTESGDDGRFEMRVNSPGEYSVGVTAPGHCPSLTRVVVEDGGVPEVEVLLQRGGNLTVVVDPEGRGGAPSYSLRLLPVDREAASFPGRGLGGGTYRFESIEPGAYRVELLAGAQRGRSAEPPLSTLSVEIEATSDQTVVLDTGRLSTLVGALIVDGDPAPMHGVSLERAGSTEGVRVKTDRSGGYALRGLPAGAYRLAVQLDPEVSEAWSEWLEIAPSSTERREIAFLTGSLSGTLVDPGGEPVTTAIVRLERPVSSEREPSSVQTLRTDASGRFESGRVAAGSLLMSIEGPGLEAVHRAPVEILGGAPLDLGTIECRPGGRLVVAFRVGAAASEPVTVRVARPGALDPIREVSTRGLGRITFDGLPAGMLQVSLANADARVLSSRAVRIDASREETILLDL